MACFLPPLDAGGSRSSQGASRIWELYPSSDPAIEDAWAGLLGDDEWW